jgi:hypothetical protein
MGGNPADKWRSEALFLTEKVSNSVMSIAREQNKSPMSGVGGARLSVLVVYTFKQN